MVKMSMLGLAFAEDHGTARSRVEPVISLLMAKCSLVQIISSFYNFFSM